MVKKTLVYLAVMFFIFGARLFINGALATGRPPRSDG